MISPLRKDVAFGGYGLWNVLSPYIEGGLDRYLHYVHHGVLEEDEVHMSATNRLVVLTHEHPQSFLENLVIR